MNSQPKSTLKTWFFGFFTCLLLISLGLNVVLLNHDGRSSAEVKYLSEQQSRMDKLAEALAK